MSRQVDGETARLQRGEIPAAVARLCRPQRGERQSHVRAPRIEARQIEGRKAETAIEIGVARDMRARRGTYLFGRQAQILDILREVMIVPIRRPPDEAAVLVKMRRDQFGRSGRQLYDLADMDSEMSDGVELIDIIVDVAGGAQIRGLEGALDSRRTEGHGSHVGKLGRHIFRVGAAQGIDPSR